MNKPTKICRICGKEYEACSPAFGTPVGNRWQDVACCVEHANEYFAKVEASRRVTSVVDVVVSDEEAQKTDMNTDIVKSDDVPVEKKRKRKTAEPTE